MVPKLGLYCLPDFRNPYFLHKINYLTGECKKHMYVPGVEIR